MASNNDMVARISAAVCNALRNSQQQIADGLLSSEMLKCLVDQGLMPARHTDELDVCRTVSVREKPVKT